MNAPRPLSLLAELTYRCNLRCPYCYNPLRLRDYRDELSADQWRRVLEDAAALGVLQCHFSGGEPTLRADDLCLLIAAARASGLYTNLITQGTFLTDALVSRLEAAGLDHVQISVQAAEAELADEIAGAKAHAKKRDALARVAASKMALTLNCVLHRDNIEQTGAVIALAEEFGVRRLELANTQLYGWAFVNRARLLPTRAQVESASAAVAAARKRTAGRMEIAYVLADYYERYPKPCMHGWGRAFMTVAPDGRVLPCPAAAGIEGMRFDNVRDRPLADIWQHGEAFERYRGVEWMAEPCRSCDRRDVDFGGCRCQAFLVAGDAGRTDPACSLSPDHHLIEEATAATGADAALIPRRM